MPTDQCYLRDTQAHLKEPADSLMAQVVEPQVLNTRTTPHTLPCEAECIGRDWEHQVYRCAANRLRRSLTGLMASELPQYS